jgi:hypothetical protein
MKRLTFVVTVLLFTIALPAAAQIVAPSTKDVPPGGCVIDFSTGGCFTDGSTTTGGTTGGTTTTTCIKSTNYSTCIAHCKCEYDKAVKECKQQVQCIQIARLEKSACDGMCITDYP